LCASTRWLGVMTMTSRRLVSPEQKRRFDDDPP
jgi:hypothetical protein